MEELSIVGELPIQCFRLLPGVLLDRVRDAKSGSKQPSATTLHLALSWPWPHFYLCIRLWSANNASSWSFPTRCVGLLPCSAEIWNHMNVISKIPISIFRTLLSSSIDGFSLQRTQAAAFGVLRRQQHVLHASVNTSGIFRGAGAWKMGVWVGVHMFSNRDR